MAQPVKSHTGPAKSSTDAPRRKERQMTFAQLQPLLAEARKEYRDRIAKLRAQYKTFK